jgi:hypothetical protein
VGVPLLAHFVVDTMQRISVMRASVFRIGCKSKTIIC